MPDDLASGFSSPPNSTKPTVCWHWLDDNISKAGITADLEEMKRVGIGGAIIDNAGGQVPLGTVKFGSDYWYDMVLHATKEANRLGLNLEITPDMGWAAAGGTWIDPAHSMLRVTTSEIQVKGPAHFTDLLPQPATKLNFYRDITVLAFPTSPADAVKMSQFTPAVTSSDPAFDGQKIIDGDAKTTATLQLPSPGKPQYVDFEFSQPYQVRSFTITPGGGGIYNAGGELQNSNDGRNFSSLQKFRMDRGTDPQSWPVAATSARFYRVVFNKPASGYNGGGPPPSLTIAEISLQPSLVIMDFVGKAAIIRNDRIGASSTDTAISDLAIDSSKTVDISKYLQPDGHLIWDIPAGNWTILRLGYTTTGSVNAPATPDAKGLECDKLSGEAADLFWSGLMGKVLNRIGPLAGKTLKTVFVDSWEAGSQNWTPNMLEEFKKRRGYDMTPYLPTFAGHIVNSPEQSDRFLWDLRRTIADLCADNFFSHIAQLSHKAGLQFSVEPYGDGPFEDLAAARDADLPRGEFWPGRMMRDENSPKLAASIGHTYGRTIIGTESFTDFRGRWKSTPEKLKPLGDLIFTLGINFFYLHEYAHQPWPDIKPGMTLGQFGSNFNREVTWAEQSSGWMQYLTRCQYLLQQGLCVADFLYFKGEKFPFSVGKDSYNSLSQVGRRSGPMAPPAGYDYDECSEDVILHRLSVKDGRLVLPDGMSYRALILPPSDTMTPELLRKLKELADGGAMIIGPKALQSPSLSDYPQCDEDVRKLGDELWNGGKITDHKLMAEIIPLLHIKPDFEYQDKTARLLYTHRAVKGTEIYFVSNQNGDYEDVDCLFRVQGKAPELWHPDTGKMEKAPLYAEEGDRTRVSLHFEPSGSVFVVFRDLGQGTAADHAVSLTRLDDAPRAPASTLQITRATYESPEKLGSTDVTSQIEPLVRNGGLSMTVDPDIFIKDPAHAHEKQLRVEYVYNGTPGVKIADERERLTLGNVTPAVQFPDAQLEVQSDQSLKLVAWQPGTYKIKTLSGKEKKVVVANVPEPVAVAGPWELSFPPHWGAPDRINVDQLISWSDHPNDGVKYFSGTATYHKTLSVRAEMLGPNRHLYLDLGEVKVIAEVTLNGKNLGILWKQPFCLEITNAAKAGDNAIEIKVTNLWPNRMIGDENLPPDCEWCGNALKQWPDWLLQNKRSPAGRFTFTTWHQWTKEDNLLESGLLGPVSLRSSVDTIVP